MGFAPKTARSAGRAAMGEVTVSTDRRTQLLDVTASIAKLVHDSGVQQGTCHLYVPHTSAGVIINENADQDVIHDLVMALERIAPKPVAIGTARETRTPTSRPRWSERRQPCLSTTENWISVTGRVSSSANLTGRAYGKCA